MADKVINLRVNANTSEAKQALQDLQRQLDQLTNPTKLTSSNMSSELMKAAQAAEILKTQLAQATNVNTGRLDLTKFTQQLSQSGMSLEKYQQYFKQFGANGQKAFSTLATSIAQAEIPLKNMNSMTQKMWTSIKNTINWQISSSLIHGIVGQFSTMVNYAKDLDKSLNNIQIVTGASAQKMTQFAQQANQAAKQLNTTTTAYTNASLIYYQQGLSDKEVKARTDITVKMANVTKESVTDVSNQLTAIWNNFSDGTDNLEHFADVITALGAATASSSKEIATGLEKFASIADTVGLSYEKATAALATVTAKTRQSADTVGTGFRTIFSRLQSLSLGKTLEDGVNLTKYTKALKTVGVQALDTQGNLRSMDDVLMDVGEKWKTLTNSQQMAFANTVGGVRQYATLIALMDDFETFKSNLSIAETSDGTLQNQADIYAESWEAAGKRVRATAEGIYGRLVNSDDMASLMDTFSGFLEMIQGIIDGLGGLKGVLATLGAIATTVFSKQISTGLENMGMSLMTMTRAGRNYLTEFQKNAINTGISYFGQKNNERDAALVRSYKNQQADNLAYLTYGSRLNESQQAQMRGLMDFNRGLYAKAEEAGAEAFTAKTDYQALRTHEEQERYNQAYNDQIQKANAKYLAAQAANKGFAPFNPTTGTYATGYEDVKNNPAALAAWLRTNNYLTASKPQAPLSNNQITEEYNNLIGYGRGSALLDIMTKSKTARTEALGDWETMRAGIKERVGTYKDENGVEQINYQEFFKGLGELSAAAVKAAQALDTLKERSDSGDIPPSDTEGTGTPAPVKNVDENAQKLEEGLDTSKVKSQASTEVGQKAINTDIGVTNTAGAAALGRDKLLELLQQPKDLTGGQAISKIAGAATAAASAVMMLSNAFKVLGDDSATGSQKLGAAMSMIMGIGTALPAISGIVDAFGTKVVLMGGLIKTTFAEVFAVVAAVAAVGALIGYVISKTDTDEKQLKRATESARELQDNYKAAADYSKSLKDAFSNYDSVEDTLNTCIKYSDEWYATLENVRSTILDIIQEFPELAQFGDALEWDEELGGYRLNEVVRQQAIEAAEQNELITKAAALEGQNNLNILKAKQQKKAALSTASTQAYKDIISSNLMSYTTGSGDNTENHSFAIGTVLSNWLSALTVDQLQLLKASGFKEELAAQIGSSKEFASYVSEYNQDHGTEYTTESLLKSIDTELIQFSNNYTKNGSIDELIEAQKQGNLEETAQFNKDRLIASNALKDQGYSALEMDIAARAYREKVDKTEANILSILKAPGRAGAADNWGKLNSNFTKVIEDYIKASNGKYTQAVLDDVISESGTQRYINLQTTSGVENVRIETIASTVAAQRALENMGNSADAAKTKLETLDTNFQNIFGTESATDTGVIATGLKNFMATQSLGSGMSAKGLELLNEKIQDDPAQFLMDMFGLDEKTRDAFAVSLGYTDTKFAGMLEAFNSSRQVMSSDNEKARTRLQELSTNFGGSNTNSQALLQQLGTSTISELSDLYENTLKYGNEDTTRQLNQLFSRANSVSDIEGLLAAFQNTDWTSINTASNDFIKNIAELTNIDISQIDSFDTDHFVSSMTTIQTAANSIDISGFAATIDSIQGLISGVTTGTVISKEDLEGKYKGYNFSGLGYTDSSGRFIVTADKNTFIESVNTQTKQIATQRINTAEARMNNSLSPVATTGSMTDVWNLYRAMGKTESEITALKAEYDKVLAEATDHPELYGSTNPYEAAAKVFRGKVNTALENYDNEASDEYNTAVLQAAEASTSYAELMSFLTDNNNKYLDILKANGVDIDQLQKKVVLTDASIAGFDTTEVERLGNLYYEDKTGKYSTTGYATKAEAMDAVVTEMKALKRAEELQLDIDKIKKDAEEAWLSADHGGYTSYTEALEASVKAEKELYSFRDDLRKQASLEGINYDNVIEYAKHLREIGVFTEDAIEASEKFALTQLALEQGVKALTKNWKTWEKALNSTEKDTWENSQQYIALRNALANILGTNPKQLTKEFIERAHALGLLEEAATGSKDGIKNLQAFSGAWEFLATNTDIGISELANMSADEIVDTFLNNMGKMKLSVDEFNESMENLANRKPGELIPFDSNALVANLAGIEGLVDTSLTNINKIANKFGFEYTWEPIAKEITQEMVDASQGAGIPFGVDGEQMYFPLELNPATVGTTVNGYRLVARDTGTGTGGGGGGGGGKKEPHKPKRYRNIENQIQNNKRKTDAASRNKDRAVGTAKLEYLEKERELREENLKLEQQYQKEIEDWLDKDRDKMMEAFAAINFTPIFDEAGEVINNDAFELAFEAIGDGSDEAWKKAEEALAQYEETLDKLNDKLEEIQELQDAIYDAALEATKLKLDLQLDVSIDRFEYLDYLLDKIDDDAYQAAEAIALLGDKTAETMKKVNTYTTGLEDILSRHGFSLSDLDNLSVEDLNAAGFTQSEIDQIKEWRSELLKANQDLLEIRKTIIDKVISAFNDLNEKVQKSYDKFDAYNSVLEKYKNITDLMGRNMSAQSRQIMNQLSNTMLRNAQNTAAAARRIYEDAEMEMAQAQLAYQLAVSSGDQEAIRRWQEVIDATSEHLQEAEEQWLDSWNNALEQAKTMFEDMMEQIQEDYSATMGSTFGSLDYLQAAYDRQKEIGEMYKRDFDRLYDLSKLSRDISKAIDDNDNIKGKQKLRALQAEINKLQADGTRLSEYDVEVLRKKFELEQARLALDDAQNAKSQVRLQRDANGNWGYVYTANEDKIAEAEQAYEDKLHEYQVLNDDYINQLQDKALEVQQTWSEVVGEIYSDLGLGVITDEEAAARLEEANRWLNEQRAYFEEQSNHALENQASLYDRTLNTYHIASAEIVDTWGETNLALLTKIDELQTYMNNWNEASETFLSHSAEVIDKYKEDIDKINDMAGISTTKFENHIDNVVVNINDMSDDTLTSVNDLSETMRNEFSSALSEAVNWELQYVNAMDAMINRNETFVKSLNLMIEKLAGVNTSITEMLTPLETLDNIINQSTTPVYYQNNLSELTGTSAQHILSLLNANIAAYSAGLGQLSNPMINGLSTTIDQNVTITASFPNATNHSEIEEAFTNLINKASQYANRKGY